MLPTDYNENIFAFFRVTGNNKVLVILNLSSRDKLQFRITHPLLEGNYTHLFSDITYKLNAVQSFELQAWEYIVLSYLKNIHIEFLRFLIFLTSKKWLYLTINTIKTFTTESAYMGKQEKNKS